MPLPSDRAAANHNRRPALSRDRRVYERTEGWDFKPQSPPSRTLRIRQGNNREPNDTHAQATKRKKLRRSMTSTLSVYAPQHAIWSRVQDAVEGNVVVQEINDTRNK
jgi:hypothetical protein